MDDVKQIDQEYTDVIIDKVQEIEKNMVKLPTDDPEYRKEAQLHLAQKDVNLEEFKQQLKEMKEATPQVSLAEELEQVKTELKNTQMTNEALKGILGQLCIFAEQVLPELQKTAGEHQSFFQIQQMVMIGKALSSEPMPQAIEKELKGDKTK